MEDFRPNTLNLQYASLNKSRAYFLTTVPISKAIIKQVQVRNVRYMQFAVQNMKFRLEEYRVKRKSGSNAQICKKPGTQKDEQGKRISMYDENYECAFDMVDCEGLDPWNYLRLLDLGR